MRDIIIIRRIPKQESRTYDPRNTIKCGSLQINLYIKNSDMTQIAANSTDNRSSGKKRMNLEERPSIQAIMTFR